MSFKCEGELWEALHEKELTHNHNYAENSKRSNLKNAQGYLGIFVCKHFYFLNVNTFTSSDNRQAQYPEKPQQEMSHNGYYVKLY